MSVRSCYPEAKRLCEALCASYADEYRVPAKVIRLAQTFGPGVPENDNRVFAEFIRCAKNKQDIILQTAGSSKRCYLYTADAVTAILVILLNGESGEAYNAANENTYCSIKDMANLVKNEICNEKIEIIFETNNIKRIKTFMPQMDMKLSIGKLKKLGWIYSVGLKDMYLRTIIK